MEAGRFSDSKASPDIVEHLLSTWTVREVVPLSVSLFFLLYFNFISVFLSCLPLPCKCSLDVQQNQHDYSFLNADAFFL